MSEDSNAKTVFWTHSTIVEKFVSECKERGVNGWVENSWKEFIRRNYEHISLSEFSKIKKKPLQEYLKIILGESDVGEE